VRNRRRVVYYTILLLLILGELLGERIYIIIIFPEYDIEPMTGCPEIISGGPNSSFELVILVIMVKIVTYFA